MKPAAKLGAIIASVALLAPAAATEPALPAAPERGIVDGVFVSAAMPALRIRIDERFRYLGRDRFVLKGVAHVDRHHWVAVRERPPPEGGQMKEVEAMIVLQFEGFLDGVDDHYRYSIPSGA